MSQHTEEGILSVTSGGVGFLAQEGQDIRIEHQYLGTALHGDLVEVALPKHKRDSARVLRVLERRTKSFVGVVEREQGNWFLKPDNKRIHTDFLITENTRGLTEGYKVLVTLTDWESRDEDPKARVEEILGKRGEHEVEMRAVVLERGFDLDFPPEVEQAAQDIEQKKAEISKQEIPNRRDFREIATFTIDPYDAKDFDDAISVQTLDNGNVEIGIHIADVSAYVKKDDPIDKEAQHRGTSIYLVDRTVPMLPEVLSNDVCSLNPDEDKLTFSAVFELTKDAQVKSHWFGETVIRSQKRFTYQEAQDTLDTKNGIFLKELEIANDIALKLREKRLKSGSVDFEQDEVEFELDENFKPVRAYRKERIRTMMLIEDLMLLANREVATYVHTLCKDSKKRSIFVYRIHDYPDPDKIEELSIFLRAIGYDLESQKGHVTPKALNKLFKQIEGEPEEELIKKATVRSMAKAVYSTKNIGHFGLAFEYYTHFTSPIRRYPDLMVHRLLKRHLDGSKITAKEIERYERLAIQSSQREIAAVEAERESIKYKQVEYMQDHIGEEFDALVSGVAEWGIFVEEVTTKAEGLVHINTMRDDYYEVDKSNYRLVGKGGKKYQLGDEVRVKLVGADLERKELDFKLIN